MRFDGADEPASYPALLERITDAASRLRHVARGRGQRSLQDTAQGLGQVARSDFCSEIRIRDAAQAAGVPGWRTVAPLGYWEAKDEDDDLDAEIEKKF